MEDAWSADNSPPQAPPPTPRLKNLDFEFLSPPESHTPTPSLHFDLEIPIEEQEDQWLEICVEILVDKICKYLDMSLSDDFIKQKLEEAERDIAEDRARRGILPGQPDPLTDGYVPPEEEMNDRPFIANYARRLEGSFFTPLELANVPAFLAQPGPSKSFKEIEAMLDNWQPCGFVPGCVMPDNPLVAATKSGGMRNSFGVMNAEATAMRKRVEGLMEEVEREGGYLVHGISGMGVRVTERGQRVGSTLQRRERRAKSEEQKNGKGMMLIRVK